MINKNTTKIKELAKQKTLRKREAVLNAIDRMKKEGIKISFSSVANEAGVSRNYLYKSGELRTIVESLRDKPINGCISKDARDILIENQREMISDLKKELKILNLART